MDAERPALVPAATPAIPGTPAPAPARATVSLSPAQRLAVEAGERRVWVRAAAGSGKTRCLVERLVDAILKDPDGASSIVAFTFTVKAAQEMQRRLREELYRRGPREAVRAVDRLRIGTIDSFCSQTLREHATEAGLDPRFEILDETEAGVIEQRVAERVLEEAVESEAAPLASWFARYEPDDLVLTLIRAGWKLRNAGDPLALLEEWERGEGASYEAYSAGLEPAKLRLQHDLLAAWRAELETLARHPSRKPTETAEALEAIASLAGPGWDLDAWKRLRGAFGDHRAEAGLKEDFREARADVWRELDPGGSPLKQWFTLEKSGADPELYRQMLDFVPLLKRYLNTLAAAKRKMVPQRLDFQDVLLEVLRLTETSSAFASFCSEKLRAVMVDELQDVNGLQSRLIDALGAGGRIFGVGDPMQSIYRFRHADVSLFLDRLSAGRTEEQAVYPLRENYRSREGILDFVNHVFAGLSPGSRRYFESVTAGRAAPATVPAMAPPRGVAAVGAAALPPLPEPPVESLIVSRGGTGDEPPADQLRLAEARAVASRLLELREAGFPVSEDEGGAGNGCAQRPLEWSDVAVLFRARTAIPVYAKAMAELGIPTETLHQSDLLDSVEGRDFLALLEVFANPRNDLAMLSVLRSPFVDLADGALLALSRLAQDRGADGTRPSLYQVLADEALPARLGADAAERVGSFLPLLWDARDRILTEGAAVILRQWMRATGYLAREGARRPGDQIAANIRSFLEWCRVLEPSKGDLAGLLQRLHFAAGSDRAPSEAALQGGRGVQLLTIHAAKGLEHPVVVLAQMGRECRRGGSDRGPLLLRIAGSPRRPQLALRLRAGFGNSEELRGWAGHLLAEAEECDSLEEEERLFYVGATRARERLILAGTPERNARLEEAWKDRSYAAWMESALHPTAACPGGGWHLLRCNRVSMSATLEQLQRWQSSRPLAVLHAEKISAGQPLPVEASEEEARRLALDAANVLERAVKLVPEARLIPRDIGAAELGRALGCPWEYRYRHYLDHLSETSAGTSPDAAPVRPPATTSSATSSSTAPPNTLVPASRMVSGTERGARIHRFFETLDLSRPLRVDFERAAQAARLSSEDAAQLSGWLALPEIPRAMEELYADPSGVRRELTFEWRVTGTRVGGRLDALVRLPDGRLRVVDFKTDGAESRQRLERQYEWQTALYAAAVERAGLGEVAGRRLIYLQLGRIEDFPWKAHDSESLEQEVEETLRLLGRGDFMGLPACEACPMRKLHPEGHSCPDLDGHHAGSLAAARDFAAAASLDAEL